MFEVRFHGRGGQGAVMAAQALASAAFEEGGYAVAFPFFGSERRGAPVLAFTRIDKKPIRVKTQVYEPDFIVILDGGLIGTIDVAAGLKKGGMAIVNTTKRPEEIDLGIDLKIATVDATGVALEVLKRPVFNSAILGAVAKATGIVSMKGLEKGIVNIFGGRLGEKVGAINAKAAAVAYDRTIIGESKGKVKLKSTGKWLPTVQEMLPGAAIGAHDTAFGKVGVGSMAENKTGSWKVFKPKYDKEACTMCLTCWWACPEGCIYRTKDKLDFDMSYCKGCGICANECPADAIEMARGDEQ
jgi:2-oxoacid:acceptor oxidoreductase gamma subunit (pyruvate/2-ketoisovalerate family)/2-oxoacid:acceptor oxidoreductase delta subunit (pyruvate/2-ketoisovalerate family)